MTKGRLEAFSDGVIAIIITIMVLEFKTPDSAALSALIPLLPKFGSYALSFLFVAIYWNNHHHLLQAAKQISARVMWVNMLWLFWLSMVPFCTAWVSEHGMARWPVVLYGVVLMICAVTFNWLSYSLKELHGEQSLIANAIGSGWRGVVSTLLSVAGVLMAFFIPWLGFSLYAGTGALWLIPSKKIEQALSNDSPPREA